MVADFDYICIYITFSLVTLCLYLMNKRYKQHEISERLRYDSLLQEINFLKVLHRRNATSVMNVNKKIRTITKKNREEPYGR